jgi:hypothetical protein
MKRISFEPKSVSDIESLKGACMMEFYAGVAIATALIGAGLLLSK